MAGPADLAPLTGTPWAWALILVLGVALTAAVLRIRALTLALAARALDTATARHVTLDEPDEPAAHDSQTSSPTRDPPEPAPPDLAECAKTEFLANISHEIRTPVNAVIGHTHLLLQSPGLSAKQRDHLGRIRSSSQHLLVIINNILDLAELEAGRVAIEAVPFRVDDVVSVMADLVSPKARDKGLGLGIEVADDIPPMLVGDPMRLEQILGHLCNNAVKFTEQGEILVSAFVTRVHDREAWLRFVVKDTGIGIAEHRLDSLFAPFSQADGSPRREHGGPGTGLAITQRLAGLLGGSISVSSALGVGTELSVDLPFAVAPEPSTARPAPPADLRGLQVLVVDDSRSDRKVLCESLTAFHFEARAVCSGREALATLHTAQDDPDSPPYELVLLDWHMPDMDGFEVARRIKHSPDLHPKPPVILITGHGREDVLAHADHQELDGFLLKPVSPSLLFDAIMSALGRSAHEHTSDVRDPLPPARPQLGGASVLLVEDNIMNQEVAQELLANMGVRVTIANDGREAVQAARAGSFDLILMDIQMPVMDGYQTTLELRKDPDLAAVPIVAMTAHALSSDRDRCLAAGMNDYLSKPIDTDRLYEVLSQWIEVAPRQTPSEIGDDKEPALPELPGLDLEPALHRVGGNRALLRKVLIEFYQDYRGVVDTITTALELGHTGSVIRLVHTLKGLAGTIGAQAVQRAAGELESVVDGGDMDHCRELLARLELALDPLLDALSSVERDTAVEATTLARPRAPVDAHAVEPIIAELAELLMLGDPDATRAFASLLDALAGAGLDSDLDTLRNQIEGFDFDQAQVTLDRLCARLGAAGHGS